MSKKPTNKDPIVFTSELLRMVNVQTLGANATVESAEALTTPGVSDGQLGGMFVVAAKFSFSPLLGTGGLASHPTGPGRYTCQIQTGDRSADPATLEPDSPYFFASLSAVCMQVTSGATLYFEPVALDIARPEPVIVMDKFTVTHHGANQALHNDEKVFLEIIYRTCLLDETVYSRLLRNQSRVS